MKANYHTHTRRCLHAQGTEEEYVQAAVRSGLSILGFSDHAPYPDHDFGLRMPYSELDEYLDTIDALTKVYSTDIILWKSLEIEYLPEYQNYYEDLLTKKHLDYLLLGEHFYRTAAGIENIYNASGTDWYLRYSSAIAEALKTGYFKILAHPDLFLMGPFVWDKNCDLAAERIIEAAVQTDTILEYNANGFRRGIQNYPDGNRYMYPDERFWKKVRGSGACVIIGSDCHNPSQVWDSALDQASAYLENLGLNPILSL